MHEKVAEAPASLKPKPVATRILIGGIIALAAVVFGAGIDWGLPSHAIDPILFGSGSQSATNELNSFHLTGVGIDRLAGSWDQNANLAADVAAHPIGDRSKPVTLLQNPYVATAEDLVSQDDRLATLMSQADRADAKYGLARLGSDEKAADAAQDAAVEAQHKVKNYVDEYNKQHVGDVSGVVAQDDVTRARILRRYRLYSYQPDEMISFRALAMMHPGKMEFDPKLYQYGGLWIYPLGGILKAASLVGYVTATNDSTYYLDSPESFGKFYILARAYSAAWGIVGALAVFAIMRRACVGLGLSTLAAVCFICLPVVVDLAHEAKPHLAGCSLMLLAVWAALGYVQTGKWKWAVWTGIICGAAAGMILWGTASVLVLLVMALARQESIGKRVGVFVAGLVIAGAIYCATNPYVAVHLLGDRSVLDMNVANSEAMYGFRPDFLNTIRLAVVGMSWPIAMAGVIGIIAVLASKGRTLGWLLLSPALVLLIEFFEHSGGKPGEYARFAVFADVALMLGAFLAVARFPSIPARIVVGSILVIATGIYSFAYVRGFARDATRDNSRMAAAQVIDGRRAAHGEPGVLYVISEPAPYCLPPVNLFRWRLVLLPRGETPGLPAGLKVEASEWFNALDPTQTPISWADRPFEVVQVGAK